MENPNEYLSIINFRGDHVIKASTQHPYIHSSVPKCLCKQGTTVIIIIKEQKMLSTLTYGCESWKVRNKLRSKIQAAEVKYLKIIQGVTRLDRIRNVKIREELQLESTAEFIERRQLSWWGHINRMKKSRQVRQV